ncbi:30S ribosomal protein S4e [Conexivisphaera calida]|nr:30S ribosomal protein S4e [Conexivisphaera calida]
MARMGRSTVQKRLSAPRVYAVPRKPRHGRFLTKVGPGPHPKELGIDLVTLLRDYLRSVSNAREALYVLKNRYLLVDGVVRTEKSFPVGLMDVIEVAREGKVYRMVPAVGRLLHPAPIPDSEKGLKISMIRSKVTVPGGRVQLGTHDGRSFLVDDPDAYFVGDSLLIKVPSQEIVSRIPLEEGTTALVIGGERLSSLGKVVRVIPGSFSVRPAVELEIGQERVLVPKELAMPVGMPEPPVTVRWVE